MIIKIKILVIITLLYFTNSIFGQVNIVIDQVQVNDVLINSGTPINMGSNSSVNIKFRIVVSKYSNVDYGICKLNIGTYKNGSFTSKIPEVNIDLTQITH